MHTLSVCIGVVALYELWRLWSLFSNYRIARKSGFPVYLTPVNPLSLPWMIASVPLRPVLARCLPASIWNRLSVSTFGWEFSSKQPPLPRLRKGFVLVTPGRNEFWVVDPEMAQAILLRRKDFIQMDISNAIMGIFGPNVITADGEDWQRQRKIVAPVLNERISGVVWKDSSKQAREMLEYFTKASQGETDETINGVRSVAINVLGSAGYGIERSWQHETEKPPPGRRLTYMEAISAVANNLVVAAFISARISSLPIMSKNVRTVGAAKYEYPTHIKDLLEMERASTSPTRNNMLSVLVKLSDDGKKQDSKSSLYLSEEEIRGNLFQFTLAGYDTTANTMAYAITTLAAHPEWQEWIVEEIDQVAKLHPQLGYEETFPALQRCLALMHEILRLYTPVAHISRSTAAPQQFTTSSGSYFIPANSVVYISATFIHTRPDVWGPDALTFRPTRWLVNGSFLDPDKGTYLPWSGGPRVCPGTKMSQVEFVAVMVTIFKSYQVSPVVGKGETLAAARKKLDDVMADSNPKVTLQMNRPRDVKLKWTRR